MIGTPQGASGLISLGSGGITTNIAAGVNALASNITATGNTALGSQALQDNTTGGNNTAIGRSALQSSLNGASNTALGAQSLLNNVSGGNNTAAGVQSLLNNLLGSNNTAFGIQALRGNGEGNLNTAIGVSALRSNSDAANNTAIGANALRNNSDGESNTASGTSALLNNVSFNNTTGLGYNAQVTGDNQVQLGDSATTTYAYGAVQDRSDVRDKTDIRDTQLGLEFIDALRPVDFRWDMREDYRPEMPSEPGDDASEEEKEEYEIAKEKWLEDSKLANIEPDGTHKRNRYHHGLIAQEVKAILEAKGIDFGGFQDHKIAGGDDVLSIGYNELIAPMIKAIQELSARVQELEASK